MTASSTLVPAPFFRRVAAYMIDVALLYVYIIALFGASMAVNAVLPFHQAMGESYLLRHAIAFFTLSLPVLIWFWRWESGAHQATPGKRIMKIRLQPAGVAPLGSGRILVRNVLKFLPWEWAHTFLHIHPDFLTGAEVGLLPTILGMYLPQVMVLGYALTVAIRKDGMAPYDLVCGTQIVGSSGQQSATKAASQSRTMLAGLVIMLASVLPLSAQHRPDEAVARISMDRQTVESGSLSLQNAIGFSGYIVVNRVVLGGSGRVHIPVRDASGTLSAGEGLLDAGLVLAARPSWKAFSTASVGIRGSLWSPASGSTERQVDLVGRIALHLDRSVPGLRPDGAARIGVLVGWHPTLTSGPGPASFTTRRVDVQPWVIGLNLGFGVGSARQR